MGQSMPGSPAGRRRCLWCSLRRGRERSLSLTQYYTATTLDGFIADPDNSLEWLFTRKHDLEGPLNYGEFISRVGALAMGATTYEWILDHEFSGKDPSDWEWIVGGGDLAGQFADAGLLDEVIVSIAPVTLGAGAPLLPRRLELQLEELARNGDLACARFTVVRPSA